MSEAEEEWAELPPREKETLVRRCWAVKFKLEVFLKEAEELEGTGTFEARVMAAFCKSRAEGFGEG